MLLLNMRGLTIAFDKISHLKKLKIHHKFSPYVIVIYLKSKFWKKL